MASSRRWSPRRCELVKAKPLVVDIDDALADARRAARRRSPTRSCWRRAIRRSSCPAPSDEWDSMCLLYTSGTTGDPKGVVYHHRGGYLNALGNALVFGLSPHSVYLWTLPMFHCSGWTYTWAVTAVGGTHVCLRKVDPGADLPGDPRAPRDAPLRRADRAEHAGACAGRGEAALRPSRRGGHGRRGAAVGGDRGDGEDGLPRDAPLRPHRELRARRRCAPGRTSGMRWGSTSARCRWRARAFATPRWRTCRWPIPRRGVPVPARRRDAGRADAARQHGDEGLSREPTRHARRRSATAGSTPGDLGVRHPDGYVEIKDRSKDIIISGGENISSLEVEECLYRHPAVMEAAVVARPDEKWGETPCAFVTLKPGAARGQRRGHHRLVPRAPRALQGAEDGRVRTAAQDLHRQDPEIRAAGKNQRIFDRDAEGRVNSVCFLPSIPRWFFRASCFRG